MYKVMNVLDVLVVLITIRKTPSGDPRFSKGLWTQDIISNQEFDYWLMFYVRVFGQ